MYKLLFVNLERCVGCRLCVVACSLAKENVFSPTKSRIGVLKEESECLGIPITCEQCEDAPCKAVCPSKAIGKDAETGIVRINPDKCIGCRECTWICPFGAVIVDPEKRIAVKCDLCDGEPECAKVCEAGAIQYYRVDRLNVPKKWESAKKRAKALESLTVKGGSI